MNKLLGLNFGRDKGECSKYLNLAIESARQDGADVQIINCCNLKIDRCQGCGACSSGSRLHGKPVMCIVKDDYEMVKEAILDADAIIVAAPVYVLGPAGQLKNLIDRLGPAHDRAAMWKEFMKRVDPVPDPQESGPAETKGTKSACISRSIRVKSNKDTLPTFHWAALRIITGFRWD